MAYMVESVELAEQPVITLRDKVPRDKIGEWLAGAYGRLFGYLGREGIQPAGPPFARFVFLGDSLDAEAGVPVAPGLAAAGEFSVRSLPAGPAAVTVHVGPYETLHLAYQAVRDWVEGRGYEAAGTWWEEYLTDPAEVPDPAAQHTRVVMPYRAP